MEVSWCKRFLIDWWLLIFIAFLLWYRNYEYDRFISIFCIMSALVNLIQYGVYSGMDAAEAGTWIYVLLWAQIIALAIACHVYVNEPISAIYLTIISIISTFFIMYSFCSTNKFFATCEGWFQIERTNQTDCTDQIDNKDKNEEYNILGNWWWVYLLGIIIPFLLIGYYINSSIFFFILYGLIIAIYILCNADWYNWGPTFFLFSIGFAFITWLLIPLTPPSNPDCICDC